MATFLVFLYFVAFFIGLFWALTSDTKNVEDYEPPLYTWEPLHTWEQYSKMIKGHSAKVDWMKDGF